MEVLSVLRYRASDGTNLFELDQDNMIHVMPYALKPEMALDLAQAAARICQEVSRRTNHEAVILSAPTSPS